MTNPRPARRPLSCLGIVVPVVPAAGGVRLFPDDLPIPADAKDVHYERLGRGDLLSALMPGHLHRTGTVPDGQDLFDHRYGGPAVAGPVNPLPNGLCRSAPAGPIWIYPSPSSAGAGLGVMIECSDMLGGGFRFAARAVITFTLG